MARLKFPLLSIFAISIITPEVICACDNDQHFHPLQHLHLGVHIHYGVYPVDSADIHDEVENGQVAGHPNSFDIRAFKFEVLHPHYKSKLVLF